MDMEQDNSDNSEIPENPGKPDESESDSIESVEFSASNAAEDSEESTESGDTEEFEDTDNSEDATNNSTDDMLEASGLHEPAAEPVVTEEELLAFSDTILEGLTTLDQSQSEDAIAAADAKAQQNTVSEEQRAFVTAAMETLIFMSDKPMSLPKLRSLIDDSVPLNLYREMMTKLRAEFAADHRGIEIAEVSMGFQLRTKPQMATVLRKLVKTTPLKLTGAMMELLAVVAYKQPVTKDDVDQVRGVDCGYLLRNLMEKRLIRITGRSDLPGRPILYGTTHEFLELFSLKDTKSLPPLHEIESMVAASEVGAEDKEVQDMQTFGRMVDASLSTNLFDDSNMDSELEEIRRTIDSIPVSTSFLDEQKAREKLFARIAELNTRGLSLDAEGNEVPADTVPAGTVEILLEKLHEKYLAAHQPSQDLAAAAEAARQKRLDEILSEGEESRADAPAPVVAATETSLEAATQAFEIETDEQAFEDSVMDGPTEAIGPAPEGNPETAAETAPEPTPEAALEATDDESVPSVVSFSELTGQTPENYRSELEIAAERAREERHAAMLEEAANENPAPGDENAEEKGDDTDEDNDTSSGLNGEPTSH